MVELKNKNGPAVNLEVLDRLVHEYMLEEELIDEEGPTTRPDAPSAGTNCAIRAKCDAVRAAVDAGNTEEAVRLAESVHPAIFENLKLLFRVRKQEFVEKMRSNSEEGRREALACIRKKLTPLALHAYPEAYTEFKRALLLLVYDQHEDASPVGAEWSARSRSDLAAILSRCLRQAAGVTYPKLALLLRYLAFTHTMLRAQEGGTSSSSDAEIESLVERLLCGERDPPPFPPESHSFPVQAFPEADIQSLKEAVQLSRQEAVEALRHTMGDVQRAFTNELAAMHLNVPHLDDLVLAFAAQRDLLRLASSTESSPTRSTADQKPVEAPGPADMDIDSDLETPGQNGAPEEAVRTPRQAQDRGRGEAGREDVTGGFNRQPSKSPPKKVPRWRGRAHRHLTFPVAPDNSAAIQPNSSCAAASSPTGGKGESNGQAHRSPSWRKLQQVSQGGAQPFKVDFRHELVRRVRQKIEAHRFQEAIEDIHVVAPACLQGNSDLLFELQLASFYQLVAQGRSTDAICLSRATLTPMTQQQPHLMPRLKARAAALGKIVCEPSEVQGLIQAGYLSQLAATRMHEALDIKEPQLVQLLRVLLGSHKAWLKMQRCKDRFAPLLCLDALKSSPAPPDPALVASSSTAAHPGGEKGGDVDMRQEPEEPRIGSHAAAHDTDDEDADEDGEDLYSEQAIVLVMEFASVGRAAAIELLDQAGGDTESVLAAMFP